MYEPARALPLEAADGPCRTKASKLTERILAVEGAYAGRLSGYDDRAISLMLEL